MDRNRDRIRLLDAVYAITTKSIRVGVANLARALKNPRLWKLNACANSVYRAFISFAPPPNAWVRVSGTWATSMKLHYARTSARFRSIVMRRGRRIGHDGRLLPHSRIYIYEPGADQPI